MKNLKLSLLAALTASIAIPVFATGTSQAAPTVKPAQPTPMSCTGTEPFWHIKVEGGKVEYSDPETTSKVYTGATKKDAEGHQADFAFQVTASSGRGARKKTIKLSAIRGQCSDGMSDRVYSHSVLVEKGGRLFTGCCDIPAAQ